MTVWSAVCPSGVSYHWMELLSLMLVSSRSGEGSVWSVFRLVMLRWLSACRFMLPWGAAALAGLLGGCSAADSSEVAVLPAAGCLVRFWVAVPCGVCCCRCCVGSSVGLLVGGGSSCVSSVVVAAAVAACWLIAACTCC